MQQPTDRHAIMRLFVPLYASQYLGIGFLFTALVAISRERGGSLEEIGVIYVIGMVWAVKFLWAPLVDRFGSRRLGHYRSWLLFTQPATALLILAITPLDVVDDIGIIIVALALVAVMSSTQDIATDGLAVRTIRGDGRGGINGIQVGAGFIGDIVGGALVLVIYDAVGWVPAILSLSVLTALPLLSILRYKEPTFEPVVVPSRQVRRGSALALFRQPGAAKWSLVVTPLLVIGMPGAYGLMVPILTDTGMSVGMVGILTNGLGGVIGMIAAVAIGLRVGRLGRKRSLVLFGVGQLVAIAAVIPLAQGGSTFWAITAVVLMNVVNSAVYTIMYTINMDFSRPEHAGSDFTVQVSIAYFLRFGIASVITSIAASSGYSTALVVCLGLTLVGVLAAAFLYSERQPAAEEAVVPAVV
jgi:MFS family permease